MANSISTITALKAPVKERKTYALDGHSFLLTREILRFSAENAFQKSVKKTSKVSLVFLPNNDDTYLCLTSWENGIPLNVLFIGGGDFCIDPPTSKACVQMPFKVIGVRQNNGEIWS